MTRLRLKYVHEYIDVRGKLRRQFRRKGCRKVNLPGLPGSIEFMTAYQGALEGSSAIPGSGRTVAGSISELALRYYGSSDFRGLAASTQVTYRGIVERFRAEHGAKSVSGLRQDHIKAMVAKKADRPAAANNFLRIVRMLMQFAIAEKIRTTDPSAGVKNVRNRTEGFRTWSEEDIAAFEAKHPVGSRARLALALMLFTGQRRSDVIRMGRQHVRAGWMHVHQQKTKVHLDIPMLAELQEIIAASPSEHLTFLVTGAGKSFTAAGFGNWFREQCDAAGLSACSAHGLRKATCRRLAEAGKSAKEIMSITGHKNIREVDTYTKAAEQKLLAAKAFGVVIGMNREQEVANASGMLATHAQKPLE